MRLGLQKITKLGHPVKTIGYEGDADGAAPLTVAGDFGHEGLRVAIFVIPPLHLLPLIWQEDHRHPVAETLQMGRQAAPAVGGNVGIRRDQCNFQGLFPKLLITREGVMPPLADPASAQGAQNLVCGSMSAVDGARRRHV